MIPTLKSEISKRTCGASGLVVSESDRYVVAQSPGDGDAAPTIRVYDRAKLEQTISGWSVGGVSGQGELIYVEKADPGKGWRLRSSTRPKASFDISPPAGVTWTIGATARTKGHAVVVLIASEPTNSHPRGWTRKAWAVSVDLGSFTQAATRDAVVNKHFDQGSCAASVGGDRLYCTERPATGERNIQLIALDAATLKQRWAAPLVDADPPLATPASAVALDGDGEELFVALGAKRQGSISTDAIYGVRAADGTLLYGPSEKSLVDVSTHNVYQAVPVPGAPRVAVLLVFNLRDDHDAFFRVRMVDVKKAKVVGEVDKGVRTHAIAVRADGTVVLAPADCP